MEAVKRKSNPLKKMDEVGFDAQDINPVSNRVLIKKLPKETIGLIYIPQTAAKETFRGIVLKTGPGLMIEGINGRVRRPMDLKPGDIVHFGKWNDYEHITERDMVLITDDDILLVERAPGVR